MTALAVPMLSSAHLPAVPVRVAVIGASGYTGAELLRLLWTHPAVALTLVAAKRAAGKSLADVFPQFAGVTSAVIEEFDPAGVAARADVAFCALPHGESAHTVAALRAHGVRVLDLSADYRLADTQQWQAWYSSDGQPHPHAALLATAVYGLPERHRTAIANAALVAVPGCYPTATILAAAPLLAAGLVVPRRLIVDAKSGVSGAGRTPSLAGHFPEIAEGIRAYKVAGTHRHTPEIEQELQRAACGYSPAALPDPANSPLAPPQTAIAASATPPLRVLFTPHLVPMSRGILACVYGEAAHAKVSTAALHACLQAAYRDEPFVSVLPIGTLPDTALVRGSNRAHVGAYFDERSGQVIALAAIDNLVKGAAGQAVQCFNLMCGMPETAGLRLTPMFP